MVLEEENFDHANNTNAFFKDLDDLTNSILQGDAQLSDEVATLFDAFPQFRGFGLILSELSKLLQEEAEDDYGILRPTAESFDATWGLIRDAGKKLVLQNKDFPYGSSSTDGEGGVRIEWRHGDKEVRLCVPSLGKGVYIYYEQSDQYDATKEVTSDSVVDKLEWLETE